MTSPEGPRGPDGHAPSGPPRGGQSAGRKPLRATVEHLGEADGRPGAVVAAAFDRAPNTAARPGPGLTGHGPLTAVNAPRPGGRRPAARVVARVLSQGAHVGRTPVRVPDGGFAPCRDAVPGVLFGARDAGAGEPAAAAGNR